MFVNCRIYDYVLKNNWSYWTFVVCGGMTTSFLWSETWNKIWRTVNRGVSLKKEEKEKKKKQMKRKKGGEKK